MAQKPPPIPQKTPNELEKAIADGDLDAFKQLFAEQTSVSDSVNCLMVAQEHKQYTIAQYLLSEGAKIEDYVFQTALRKKDFDFLKLYLQYGFDLNLLDPPILL